MQIKLSQPLAADSPADSYDVRQMKKTLNRLGYYMPYEQTGITGIPDTAMFDGLKKFQADHDLLASGVARPDDDTIAALNEEAEKTPEGTYIWRTVGDGKVRSTHAALNGTERSWSDSPDPCEEYNCRCWAEQPPIPQRKPNCNEHREERNAAAEKVRKFEEQKNNLIKEMEDLKNEKDALLRRIYKISGSGLILHLIGIPLERIGWVAEIIQKWLGSEVQNITLANLDTLVKKFMKVASVIMQKIESLKTLNLALQKAREDLIAAQNALDKCRERIPNG